jgi:ADP-heptose:LPS heptosyltransferase
LSEERKKILVIRLSSLGDLVLSSSVLAPLRRANYEITFITKKNFAALVQGHPEIAGVYPYDPRAEGERKARERFFSWYAGQNFSLVLDLQDSWRTWSWRRRLKKFAPVYVARKERVREWLILLGRLGRWIGFGRGGRAHKFWLAAQRAAGVSAEPMNTQLYVGAEELAGVQPLLPAEKFAVILPASAWKGKEWPYFAELAAALAKKIPVVTLGGPDDLICDEVAASAAAVNPASRSLRGKTNLRQSMAVISRADWVIGNDTGMVHVAEALGKDVAMIEGPTHEKMGFSPYRAGSVLIGLDLVCRPCSKTGWICWRFGTRKCLYDLSVASVVERLRARGFPC